MLGLLAVWVSIEVYVAVMVPLVLGAIAYNRYRRPRDRAQEQQLVADISRCSSCDSILGRGSRVCPNCGANN